MMTLIHISSVFVDRIAIEESLDDFEVQKCLQLLLYKYKAIIAYMIENQDIEVLKIDTTELFNQLDDVQQTWSLWSLNDLGRAIAKSLVFFITCDGSHTEHQVSPVSQIPSVIEHIDRLWRPVMKWHYSKVIFAIYSCWKACKVNEK